MRDAKMKKIVTTLTIVTLALVGVLTFGLTSKNTAKATTITTAQTVTLPPGVALLALTDENLLTTLLPGATSFTSLGRVPRSRLNNGYLIGFDYRVADKKIYALTDNAGSYTLNLTRPPSASLVSTLAPRFSGGFQSLFDFIPVVNAVRIIGSNDQNYAVVNGTGNLATTAVQTAVVYATGDVNAGVDPNICGGTYTNDLVGAANTIFYAVDYDLDTLVTIAKPLTATGSSNTGGGQLQTIGPIVDTLGNKINLSPTADLNVYTAPNGVNTLIGVSARQLFTIDLNQINANLALGQTQNVVANIISIPAAESMIDIAVYPNPVPAAGTLEAENALIGGGGIVEAIFTGWTGTAYVNYADNVANSFVEFSVTQTGARTLRFRYANGSAVNRPCNITLNGATVGSLNFAPTGSFGTYTTVS